MVVVPLTQPERDRKMERFSFDLEGTNWARIAAGAGLLAGGLLLLAGNRKAGLLTAGAGTALALLDQQETVKVWWDALPGQIDKVQDVLGRVEATVTELEEQHGRLNRIFAKQA